MIQSKSRGHVEEGEKANFWASYSDLMAGMLLVFVLLLVVAMFHFSDFIRQKRELLEAQEVKLKAFHLIQQKLISELSTTFEGETVKIDPNTGVLQIGSGILFGEGEATLRPEGKRQLARIFDAYIKVILSEEFREFIKQIEIEGHTNSHGTYLFNLELSQQRALTVMKELIDRAGSDRQALEQMVVAGGRSFSHLVRDAQGREDKVRSRRIEIKFRLKESEMFQDIFKDLSQ